MSFELFLAPAEGFREWTDPQWEEFWGREPEKEWTHWNSLLVGFALEVVQHNLEGDQPGSRFPLLLRADRGEHPGWYHAELNALLDELDQAAHGLSAVPITRQTMQYDNDEDVQRWIDDVKHRHPDRAVESLYGLFFRFFDEFRELVRVAMRKNRGIVVSC